MEILTVGERQDNRLYIVRINDVRILIGSPVDLEQMLNYLPEGIEIHSDDERAGNKRSNPLESKTSNKYYIEVEGQKYLCGELKYDLSLYTSVDIASVDYILITKLDNIFALPILTEGFKFEGTIIMTQPIHQIGYQMLQEFCMINEERRQRTTTLTTENLTEAEEFPFIKNIWEESEILDALEKEGKYITEWCSSFKKEDLDACWERAQVVNYKEEVTVRGGIKLVASSSGYHIGSACYSLGIGQEKLLIMDSYSLHRYRHCSPFDYKVLKDHNRILITDTFYSSEEVKPKNEGETRLTQAELSVNRFVGILKRVLKEHKNENILMPIRNLFFLLDILDILREKVPGFRRIHILTSTIQPLIKYSNANIDYLNKTLQNKIYQAKPDLPFNFDKSVEENKILFYDNIQEFVEKIKFRQNYMQDNVPSIYIVVDSTFRLGWSGKLYDIFNNEMNAGTVIFTDPYLCHSKIFEPLFHMNRLRIVNFPLNLNDSLVSTVNLVRKDTAEAKIIVHEKYYKLLRSSPIGDRLIMLKDNSAIEFDILSRDCIFSTPQVYLNLKPKLIEPAIPFKLERSDLLMDAFQGSVINHAGKLVLNVVEQRKEDIVGVMLLDKNKKLNDETMLERMYELSKKLQEEGFQILNLEKRYEEGVIYVLKCSSAIVKHSALSTEVYTDTDQEYKIIVKALKSCMGICPL